MEIDDNGIFPQNPWGVFLCFLSLLIQRFFSGKGVQMWFMLSAFAKKKST